MRKLRKNLLVLPKAAPTALFELVRVLARQAASEEARSECHTETSFKALKDERT